MGDLTAFAQSNTAARLRAAASRGALPHALIFSGPGDRASAALYAAAALECESGEERPCLRCRHCRKVLAGIHPDVIYVRDPDHRELSAEVVRSMRSDAFLLPNEGERKVYIFEDCDALNERDQNILLKTVEEGPPYAAFLFCAENSSALLQTIRSRCVELRPEGVSSGGEALHGRAEELCRLSVSGSAADRAAFAASLEAEKAGREELGAMFEDARGLFAAALLSQYGAAPSETGSGLVPLLAERWPKTRLYAAAELLRTYRRHCDYNVGTGILLGGFAAEWEELAGA